MTMRQPASERSERATRPERAGEAARERACRGVRRGEAPRVKIDQQRLTELSSEETPQRVRLA
jgi:hypothetical protein